MRYGSGNEVVNPLYSQKDYFENLTDARIGYRDFLLGFRLLQDAPPENGVEFTGIRKRYLEFTRDDLVLRAGDSYSLYGRGLAFNLFESRALAFDTGIDGVKASYSARLVRATATGGTVMYRDVNEPGRIEEYRVRAGSAELIPYKFLTLGLGFVSGEVRFPTTPLNQFAGRFDMPDYFARLHNENLDAFFSYTEKRSEVYPTFIQQGELHTGTGFYGSVSYTQEEIGVTVEYKDYRFGNADPNARLVLDRVTKPLAIQNPPIVHKEHSFTLASRYPHVIDFGDEVGFQADAYYTIGKLTGNLNVAAASRHYSYSPTGDTNRATGNPIYRGEARKNAFLPSFSGKFSPFWEVYADFQYFLEGDGNDYVEIAFNRREDQTAVEHRSLSQPLIVEVRRVLGVPIAAQYTFGDGWVGKFVAERQWVRDDANIVTQKFYNHLFSIGVSHSPGVAVALRYEFTSDEGTVDGRKDWAAIDFSFWLGTNHNLMLTAGGDRGGQTCSNGVCRVVQPFLGFRASLTSYL
jgi:hypothetical protein